MASATCANRPLSKMASCTPAVQQALRDNEFNVRGGNLDLLKSVLHSADGVGDMREPATVKNGFLHARHATETEFLDHLANLAKESEIQNQLFVVAAAQIIQQLVHDEQQPRRQTVDR